MYRNAVEAGRIYSKNNTFFDNYFLNPTHCFNLLEHNLEVANYLKEFKQHKGSFKQHKYF